MCKCPLQTLHSVLDSTHSFRYWPEILYAKPDYVSWLAENVVPRGVMPTMPGINGPPPQANLPGTPKPRPSNERTPQLTAALESTNRDFQVPEYTGGGFGKKRPAPWEQLDDRPKSRIHPAMRPASTEGIT